MRSSGASTHSTPGDVQRANVRYPGGLAARYRWAGSGRAADVFGISESIGALADHGTLVSPTPDQLCRAELRVEGPLGAWTARFASLIFDRPEGVLWDTAGLLLVKYGFHAYAIAARSGELAWVHASGTPIVAVLASSLLEHALVQSELETRALRPDGQVAWRAAHSDVVIAGELMAGRLVLTSYGGQRFAIDSRTGEAVPTGRDQ